MPKWRNLIRLVALAYLFAAVFFIWGLAAGLFKIFPWQQIYPVYAKIHEYFTFKDGPEKSFKDKLTLDHQERRSRYDFTGFQLRDPDFNDTGYLLIARYSKEHSQAIVELFSIAEKEVLHTWIPPHAEIFRKSEGMRPHTRTLKTFGAQHPLLLDNGDLIFTTGEGPMVRINACSELVWLIRRHFHHAIEIDHHGNLISCIIIEGDNPVTETVFRIRDDGFAVVSMDGKILKEYSITDLLLKNGHRTLLYGVGKFEVDRIHLNDAQPILKDNKEARIGDIALSIRNLSTVLLFDPSTGRIKWLKSGPWLGQHDINQLEDGRYSIFGNDIARNWNNDRRFVEGERSEVYFYDPLNESISRPFSTIMAKMRIGTVSGGRLRILENGDAFIEENDYSRLIRISKEKARWEYVNSVSNETVGAIHWPRYYSKNEINLDWKENLSCN